jgi:hypothetical protein
MEDTDDGAEGVSGDLDGFMQQVCAQAAPPAAQSFGRLQAGPGRDAPPPLSQELTTELPGSDPECQVRTCSCDLVELTNERLIIELSHMSRWESHNQSMCAASRQEEGYYAVTGLMSDGVDELEFMSPWGPEAQVRRRAAAPLARACAAMRRAGGG